jgi:cellulose synthase/poly-beta-1,6-N-acetylglucosamine synthase-like glycosyltransferase
MLLLLGMATFTLVTIAMITVVLGNNSIKLLRDVEISLPSPPPRVSIVVAARDEARGLEAALASLLAQDYPDYEIIVVDDRSMDATPAILERLAAQDQRLKILRIVELPAGWLGKNHALERGAGRATGAVLIFADADVIMHPSAVSRAVSHAIAMRRDHVAITPDVTAPGVALGMFMGAFTMFFTLYARPWEVSDPKSRCFIGIGAFNLVRAQVYRAVGGHTRIALRPDDDIKLGKIVKDAGYSQEMMFGRGLVSVEWYPSIRALACGLEKNSLAGVDYRVAVMLAGTLAQLLLFVWPFAALALTHGGALALNSGACIVMLGAYAMVARIIGAPRWYALGFPVMASVFVGILWRATFITLRDGGIDWRGTRYTLDELKSNRV